MDPTFAHITFHAIWAAIFLLLFVNGLVGCCKQRKMMILKVAISGQACIHALLLSFLLPRLSFVSLSTLCMVVLLYKNVEATVRATTVTHLTQMESIKTVVLSHTFTVLTVVVSPVGEFIGEDNLSLMFDSHPVVDFAVGIVFGVLGGKVLRSVLSSHRAIKTTMLRQRSRNTQDLGAVANRIQLGGVLTVISLLFTLFQMVLQDITVDYIASTALYLTVLFVCSPTKRVAAKLRRTISRTENTTSLKPRVGSTFGSTLVFPLKT